MTTQMERIRRIRRAASRGVTLVEVLIVVAIMALIGGTVGFVVLPKMQQARVDSATTNARKIRQVATQYLALRGGECPTVEKLVSEKELDAENNEDPWGKPYKIDCSDGSDILVTSAGPDGQEGSADDIIVPKRGGGGEG
jgi:general secretion pathway protein G